MVGRENLWAEFEKCLALRAIVDVEIEYTYESA